MKLIETDAFKNAMANALPNAKLFIHPDTEDDFTGLEHLVTRSADMPLKEMLVCTERDFARAKKPIDSMWQMLTPSAQETTKLLIWGLIDLGKD